MRKLRTFPALLAWLCCTAAMASPDSLTVVSVGYYEFPPYSWTAEDHSPQGSLLALTERLLRHAGYRGVYRALPGARLYAGLQDGSVQLWPGAGGKTELLGHTYEGRNTLGEFSLDLYARPGQPPPRLPDDLYGRSIILISGYSYWPPVNAILNDPQLKLKLRRTSNHRSALEMLQRRRGDYLLDYRQPVEQARRALNLPELPRTTLQRLEARMITSRHAPGGKALLEALDRAYDELRAAGEDLEISLD